MGAVTSCSSCSSACDNPSFKKCVSFKKQKVVICECLNECFDPALLEFKTLLLGRFDTVDDAVDALCAEGEGVVNRQSLKRFASANFDEKDSKYADIYFDVLDFNREGSVSADRLRWIFEPSRLREEVGEVRSAFSKPDVTPSAAAFRHVLNMRFKTCDDAVEKLCGDEHPSAILEIDQERFRMFVFEHVGECNKSNIDYVFSTIDVNNEGRISVSDFRQFFFGESQHGCGNQNAFSIKTLSSTIENSPREGSDTAEIPNQRTVKRRSTRSVSVRTRA